MPVEAQSNIWFPFQPKYVFDWVDGSEAWSPLWGFGLWGGNLAPTKPLLCNHEGCPYKYSWL